MNIDLSGIDKIAKGFVDEYKKAVVDGAHSSSGNLVRTAKEIVEWGDDKLLVSVELPDYADILEDGRKAGWPPISAIEKWIEVKPVLPRPDKNGKLPTMKQLAFLIARNMAKVGALSSGGKKIPSPKPYENTVDSFQLVSKCREALTKAIVDEFLQTMEGK